MAELLQEQMTDTDAVVALIAKDGKVLMGLREYKKDAPVWTYPGGRGEPGETVEEALRREVAEEVGVDDLRVNEYLGEKPGVKPGDRVRFFACSSEKEPQLMEPDKFLEWRWIDVNELPGNLIDQRDKEFILKLKRP